MKKSFYYSAITFGIIAAIGMMGNEDIGFHNVAGLGLFFICVHILGRNKS